MKVQHADLLAAMTAKGLRPYVQVLVDDRTVGTPRTRWEVNYSGPRGYAHSAVSGWGSARPLLAADFGVMMVEVGGYVNRAYYGEESWQTFGPGVWQQIAEGASQTAQCAMAVGVLGGNFWYYWVDGDNRTVKSYGGDLEAENLRTVVQVAAGHQVLGLAAVKFDAPNNKLALVYVDASTSNASAGQDKVLRVMWSADGKTWSGPVSWGRASGKLAYGVGALRHAETATHLQLYVAVAGKFEELAKGENVNLYELDIDTSAGTLSETHKGCAWQADKSSKVVALRYPNVMAELDTARCRIFLQRYDEYMSTDKRWQAGSVAVETFGDDSVTFGEWLPFNASGPTCYTIAGAKILDYFWCVCGDHIWRAPLYDGGAAWRVDVTADLVAFQHAYYDNTLYLENVTRAGWGYVILDNHDKRFAAMGSSGKYEALKRGAQVIFRVGYQTASGPRYATLPPMWINRIIQINNPLVNRAGGLPRLSIPESPSLGGSYVVLSLYDAWSVVTHRLARDLLQWTDTEPRDVLANIFNTYMGIGYSDDGTASLGHDADKAFEIWQTLPEKPYWPTIKAILNHCGVRLKFYTDDDEEASETAARAYVFTTAAADGVDASYGGAAEPVIYASIYWEQDRASWLRWMWWYNPPPEPGAGTANYEPVGGAPITGARVEGKDVVAEYIPFDQVEDIGVYQPVIVVDYNITGAETITPEARAASAAAQAVQGMNSGSILAPVHPGLELWDRLHITDERACVSPVDRRVAGIETYYDTRGKRLSYEQVVFLWGMEPW